MATLHALGQPAVKRSGDSLSVHQQAGYNPDPLRQALSGLTVVME